MSRERYWGLYNTASEEWLIGWSHGLGGPTPVWAMSPPIGRTRYRTASDANHARWKDGHNGYVIPRPFYVVRKPKSRELTPEAQVVIDAARFVIAERDAARSCLSPKELALMDALEHYDQTR